MDLPHSTPLDILVSSGQPWANAASVLGRPGDAGDVLWIETPLAQKRAWSRGASALLASQGFTILDPLLLESAEAQDLALLQRRIRRALAPQDGRPWHLHLNGGTKLLSTAIQEVLGNRADLHYSEPGRHHLRSFGGWRFFEPGLRVRLEDLLLCYGLETDRAGWATDRVRPEPAGPSDADRQQAFSQWQQRLAEEKGHPLEEGAVRSRWTAHDRTLREVRVERPDATLEELAAWLASSQGRSWFEAYRLRLRPNLVPPQLAAQHHHSCENIRWEAAWSNRQTPQVPKLPGPQKGSTGAAYETRVEALLSPLLERFAVMDHAANIRVLAPGSEALLVEMDHIWLLGTGRVLVLESKSGRWTVKDMRARMQTYKECFGSETRTLLVMPPLDSADPLRVNEFNQSRENADALGLDCVYVPADSGWPEGLPTVEDQIAQVLG
jgi:hypothetical protein